MLDAQWWNAYQGSQELTDFMEATYSGSYADYNVWTTLLRGDVLGCERVSFALASNLFRNKVFQGRRRKIF